MSKLAEGEKGISMAKEQIAIAESAIKAGKAELGLLYATILTLVVVPVMYSLLHKDKVHRGRFFLHQD